MVLLTDSELQQIEKMPYGVSPGPWTGPGPLFDGHGKEILGDKDAYVRSEADLEFIKGSRTVLALMVLHIRTVRRLEWFAPWIKLIRWWLVRRDRKAEETSL